MESLIGVMPVALLVLICPLMMIFMMPGMIGGHGDSAAHDTSVDDRIAELEQEVRELRDERDGKREKAA